MKPEIVTGEISGYREREVVVRRQCVSLPHGGLPEHLGDFNGDGVATGFDIPDFLGDM